MLREWTNWTPCNQFCRSQNSTRRRYCQRDPFRNEEVAIELCGMEEAPEESRQCEEFHFPCPDISDGLWYDLPNRNQGFSNYRPFCRVTGARISPRRGIPGTVLNGMNQYLRCASSRRNMNIKKGFTLSLLVKVTKLPNGRPVTFASFGLEGRKPQVSIEKLWWLNEIRFSAEIDNYRYYVRNIPLTGIQGNWKHMVGTWSKQHGARVYIDGVKHGIATKHRIRRTQQSSLNENRPTLLPGQLYLGKNSFGPNWRRGFMEGTLSSVMFWKKELSRNKVLSLNQFFNAVIDVPEGEEPVLTLPHLRLMAPFRTRLCFDREIRLSEIYTNETSSQTPFNCNNIRDAFPYQSNEQIRPAP